MGAPGLQPARQQRHVGRGGEPTHHLGTRCAPAGRRRPRAIRSGSPGSRPIGASIMPCGALGCPHTSARRSARPAVWAANWATSVVGGLGRAGDDQQPRAADVEAVDDARAMRLADAGELGEAGQQPVDQRAVAGCRRPGGRPGRPACRRRSRRRRRGRPRTRRRRPAPAARPPGSPPRRSPRPAPVRRRTLPDVATVTPSTRHAPGGDHRRRRRPADVGQQRDDPVEPLAVERRRHPLGSGSSRRTGASTADRRGASASRAR